MGGGGVMTSMRMRLVSSVSSVALILVRCRLLCEALVAASCCFTFETSTMQKPRVFEAFQTKTSKLTLKINTNQRRKAWYLRHFHKNLTNKKEQKTITKMSPKHHLVHGNHTKIEVFKLLTKNLPKINKRHTPRGGRRTTNNNNTSSSNSSSQPWRSNDPASPTTIN